MATAAITAVTAAPASAAPATGTAKIVLNGSQSEGKLGNRQVSLPVTDLDLFVEGASATARGTLKLRNGKRTARLRRFQLEAGGKETAISAKLGKARLTFFRASGNLTIAAGSATLRNARLSLTGKGAAKLRQQLGLEELEAGETGRFSLDADLASQPSTPTPPAPADKPAAPPVVDPYAAQCGLPATSEAQSNVTPAAPAPALSGAPSLSEGTIGWGFRLSFREYVATIAGGSATALAPATLVPPPPTPVQVGTFEFPAGAGKYLANTSDPGDDQAVIDGEGEAVFCALHKGKGFRITISNPTVIIDGEDSRLVVDVSTNMTGTITPAQRVDVATMEPGDAEVTYDGGPRTVSWEEMPTELTQEGLDAMQLCNPKAPSCVYNAGDALDPLTVEIVEPWGQAAACDLSGISPMPEPTVTPSWSAAPAVPVGLPDLTSPLSIDSGAINWGLRNSLRGTIQGTGVFNLLDGATKSDAVMAGSGKFFTWPATSGEFEPGTPGRLVLHGKGTVGLCQIDPAQAYGTVISDPTLVLDGANSRLVLNVSTLFRNSWTSFGPIDAVSLDIGKVEVSSASGPGAGKETTTWTFPDLGADNAPGGTGGNADDSDSANSSVKLTAAGTSGFWLLGNFGPVSPYRTVGTGLNKVVVSVVHEAE